MEFRMAKKSDLKEIVRLLADDELGSKREKYEDPLPEAYYHALSARENQGGNDILLAIENEDVIGCLQLTVIPGLTRLGMKRAQIEGERVDKKYRGKKDSEGLLQEHMTIRISTERNMIKINKD